jgi:hypothetical protein
VLALLADNNIVLHVNHLVGLCAEGPLREFWMEMEPVLHTFEELGLERTMSDETLWRTCQRLKVVLITGNRNHDGDDSLEATIHRENSVDALPVITLADMDRVLTDRAYAQATADRTSICSILIE